MIPVRPESIMRVPETQTLSGLLDMNLQTVELGLKMTEEGL